VRYGFSGSLPRQRYRCEHSDGGVHTFSLPAETTLHLTGEPVHSALIRSYRHNVNEIASALVAIGKGASYRQAALNSSAGANINGQLIANWVKVFGPVVTRADVPRQWPALAAVGAFTLQPRPGYDSLVVQIAVAGPTPTSASRLWDARIASRRPGQWRTFFERQIGSPRILVTRRGTEPAAAALQVWCARPPRIVEPRRWLRAEVIGCGEPDPPHGAQGRDQATDADIDALAHAYANSRDGLQRRIAHRRGRFQLLDQMDRVLALMRLDMNGEAEPVEYAHRIAFGDSG
jgi:hypothetical protein